MMALRKITEPGYGHDKGAQEKYAPEVVRLQKVKYTYQYGAGSSQPRPNGISSADGDGFYSLAEQYSTHHIKEHKHGRPFEVAEVLCEDKAACKTNFAQAGKQKVKPGHSGVIDF